MADTLKASLNTSQWDAIFAKLDGAARESLARRMLVSGGVILRDEAKARATVKTGTLRDSIYLAFREKLSTATVFQYSVTWNSKTSPQGHLIEFGHWRYNKIINGKAQESLRPGLKKGTGPESHIPPGALDERVWVPAKPFLRPAFDSSQARVKAAMIDRGRAEVQILLKGQ